MCCGLCLRRAQPALLCRCRCRGEPGRSAQPGDDGLPARLGLFRLDSSCCSRALPGRGPRRAWQPPEAQVAPDVEEPRCSSGHPPLTGCSLCRPRSGCLVGGLCAPHTCHGGCMHVLLHAAAWGSLWDLPRCCCRSTRTWSRPRSSTSAWCRPHGSARAPSSPACMHKQPSMLTWYLGSMLSMDGCRTKPTTCHASCMSHDSFTRHPA